jgi:plasmid stabilization system protein ParE
VMPRCKLRIEQRAEAEARSALLWYVARNPRAADRFEAAVEECIAAIAETPEQFPEIEPGIRIRLVLHRFPYAVLYRAVGDEVQVVAVMHMHRRPGYWRR